MLQKLSVVLAAVLLLAACGEKTQAVLAPTPPPAPPAPQHFVVYFDNGRATLPEGATGVIQQVAAVYKPGATVTVTGQTDPLASVERRLELSQHRAMAVRDELVRAGVPSAAIATLGSGEWGQPVPKADKVQEPWNRMVDIAIVQAPPPVPKSDAAYCSEMSTKYRQYRTAQADEAVARAMHDCDSGAAAAAVPVLEKSLRDVNIPLPSRI